MHGDRNYFYRLKFESIDVTNFAVWYEQIERLCLFAHLLPSGELILALGLLILQEGRWPLPRASCLHYCPCVHFQHVSRPGSLARFHVPGSSSC